MANIQTIKAKIKTQLDTLVSATLKEIVTMEFKKNPLDNPFSAYPVAILTPPALDGNEWEDNRTNIRSWRFGVVLIWNGENITGTADVENVIETVVNLFDNDPTLGGTCDAGVMPVTSRPAPFNYGGKDLIACEIELVCKAEADLTFTS